MKPAAGRITRESMDGQTLADSRIEQAGLLIGLLGLRLWGSRPQSDPYCSPPELSLTTFAPAFSTTSRLPAYLAWAIAAAAFAAVVY
jgi:hypothetical protein